MGTDVTAENRNPTVFRCDICAHVYPTAVVALQTKKHRLFDDLPVLEMLHDDALEELRCYTRVPDAFGINHYDRPASTHAKAGGFTALYTIWTEEQILSIQKRRKL